MKGAQGNCRTPGRRDPDLQTQLESLLHQVWLCEAEWSFEQRLRLALAVMPVTLAERRQH